MGAFFGIEGKIHVFFETNSPEVDNVDPTNIFQAILDTSGIVLDTLIQYTSLNSFMYTSDIDFDDSGFAHILYYVASGSPDSLFYMKIDTEGEIALGPLLIRPGNVHWPRVCGDQICADENGNAVIMYRTGDNLNVKRITSEGDIEQIAVVECNDFYFTTMDIGPDGDLHFLGRGSIPLGSWIPYMCISSEGDIVVEPTPVSPIERDRYYVGMNIKVDSENNLHIAYDGENLVQYMMLSEDLDTLAIIDFPGHRCQYKRYLEIDDDGIVHYTWAHTLQGVSTANYYVTIRDGELLEDPYEIPYVCTQSLRSLDLKDNKRLILRTEGWNPIDRYRSNEQYIYLFPVDEESVRENVFIYPKIFSCSIYPNPFNESCLINYSLSKYSILELSVFDLQGRKTRNIYNGSLPSGNHQFTWNGDDFSGMAVSSGTYFLKVNINGAEAQGKIINILK